MRQTRIDVMEIFERYQPAKLEQFERFCKFPLWRGSVLWRRGMKKNGDVLRPHIFEKQGCRVGECLPAEPQKFRSRHRDHSVWTRKIKII